VRSTFECPRCGEVLDCVPDSCRDWQCPRDMLEHLEIAAEKYDAAAAEFDRAEDRS